MDFKEIEEAMGKNENDTTSPNPEVQEEEVENVDEGNFY